jgi:uncharacterized YigZ family protein
MFDDTYKTLKASSRGIFKDRGSKFIATAFPVANEDEIKTYLASLRKEFHDARHHCYAWRLGFDKTAYRINDDGEPSGTAGRPVFGQIQSYDLTNILIVVVRYFGGTKLGVPGLINAYKTATREALQNAEIIERLVLDIYEISFTYERMNEVMSLVKEFELVLLQTDFQMDCKLQCSVRKTKSSEVYDLIIKIPGVKIQYIKSV